MIYGKYESVEFAATSSSDVSKSPKNEKGRVVGANSLYAQLLRQSVAEVDRPPRNSAGQVKISETSTVTKRTNGDITEEVIEHTRTIEVSGNGKLPLNRPNGTPPHGMPVARGAFAPPPMNHMPPHGLGHAPVHFVGMPGRVASPPINHQPVHVIGVSERAIPTPVVSRSVASSGTAAYTQAINAVKNSGKATLTPIPNNTSVNSSITAVNSNSTINSNSTVNAQTSITNQNVVNASVNNVTNTAVNNTVNSSANTAINNTVVNANMNVSNSYRQLNTLGLNENQLKQVLPSIAMFSGLSAQKEWWM